MDNKLLSSNFSCLNDDIKVYYLDTCVWSEIASIDKSFNKFNAFFENENLVACLSTFALSELSKPTNLKNERSIFFEETKANISVPLPYDFVIESEVKNFPNDWKMQWIPLAKLFSSSSQITFDSVQGLLEEKRSKFLQFANNRFLKLDEYKTNFPPLHGDDYTIEDSSAFAWAVSLDFLSREFPFFLKSQIGFIRNNSREILKSLKSLWLRCELIFFKYYLHGQDPKISDFIDYAHACYAPYCNVFVTEKNLSNVLKHIKRHDDILSNTTIIHVSDFLKQINLKGMRTK